MFGEERVENADVKEGGGEGDGDCENDPRQRVGDEAGIKAMVGEKNVQRIDDTRRRLGQQ